MRIHSYTEKVPERYVKKKNSLQAMNPDYGVAAKQKQKYAVLQWHKLCSHT